MPLQQLTPRFLEKVWGSEHLEPWFPDSQNKIGEVWFEGPGFLELPVLVKFLFTSGKLSVQVHPDDAYAARHHSIPGEPASRGKTEMWHVLAAAPGAQIAAGLREPVSAERLRDAAQTGEIERLLAWHDAAPGDTFFIPAGTVHAIGSGLVLCEIQQRSDITYRLYDYGRPRELHMERSLAVAHLGPHAARMHPRMEAGRQHLVACDYFTVGKQRFVEFGERGSSEWALPAGSFTLLIVVQGAGVLDGNPIRAGQVWYAPAGTAPIGVNGDCTLLWASVL
jgi:mannose-6-phosphate isomerase